MRTDCCGHGDGPRQALGVGIELSRLRRENAEFLLHPPAVAIRAHYGPQLK